MVGPLPQHVNGPWTIMFFSTSPRNGRSFCCELKLMIVPFNYGTQSQEGSGPDICEVEIGIRRPIHMYWVQMTESARNRGAELFDRDDALTIIECLHRHGPSVDPMQTQFCETSQKNCIGCPGLLAVDVSHTGGVNTHLFGGI
jgi:hypothetical protein